MSCDNKLLDNQTDIVTVVNQHSFEIKFLKQSLDKVSNAIEKISEDINLITKTLSKQEYLLEQINDSKELIQKIGKHTRQDIENLKEKQNQIEEKIKSLEVALKDLENSIIIEKHKIEIIQQERKECPQLDALNKDIVYIREKQQRFEKIFWFVGTTIIGTLLAFIIHSHLK